MKRRSSVSWKRRSCWVSGSGRSGAGVSATRTTARRVLLDRRLGKVSGKRVPVGSGGGGGGAVQERATPASRPSISTSIWCAITSFAWGYTWTKTFLHSRGLLEKAQAARRASAQAAAPAVARHDAASGRLAARLARRPAGARSDRDAGRCDERDLFGLSGRGGRHGLDVPGACARCSSDHGLPLSLYTDRGSHYFHTPEAGGKVDRTGLTQVGRALEHLGVEHIAAYSPQARGRSERAFHTLAGPADQGAGAGRDRQRSRPPTSSSAMSTSRPTTPASPSSRSRTGSAFVAIPGVDLGEILCVQEERQVGNDNCVSLQSTQAANPGEPAARPLRQGDGQSPPIPRRNPRHLPRPALPRPLRPKRPASWIRKSAA